MEALTRPEQTLLEDYRRALRQHLDGGGEAALTRAYELGRKAMTSGKGLLEMAGLHWEALARSVPLATATRTAVEASQEFFLEALSPYEIAYRGTLEANAALRKLNQMLES